ncbi:QueT transporter family protein [Candidatus Bathyarchaeota archaeon]|nr:QueT transporter family protein [Candidatus Bathyarchaeota archaeon]
MESPRSIAIAAILGSLYFVITVLLGPLSFDVIQVRISEALKVLIPIFGIPGFTGIIIGMFLANIFSPLGPIDLISPFVAIAALIPLYMLRNKGWKGILAGCLIYTAAITTWVAFILNYVLGLPFAINWFLVLIGEAIAIFGLGIPVYKAVNKYLMPWLEPPSQNANNGGTG